MRDYGVIRNELENYNPILTKKTEFVLLTKTDAVPPEEVNEKLVALKKKKLKPIPISILDEESLMEVKKILNKIKDEKERSSKKK